MEPEPDNAGVLSPSGALSRIILQPGQLSKPVKVWSSSSTLIIGFYQAAPYSETFKIFYKKSGAVFGTQVTLTPASILGPELAVRQPVAGEAQYFEYEIKKLKPSTQYVIKIKTSDDASEVRSDKMGTVSAEEERSRDNDMRNFVGSLVKLGEYDGLVVSYAAPSGIFTVRILQLDDVASSLQLARLTSDYTDNGVPVQAYTLSEIRFGRWGGAITGSKVVNEGELKWLVARAVQMGDKSDAAAAFEARQRLLQAQVEKVTLGLEAEWATRFRNLRLRAAAYLLLLALVAVAAGGGCWTLLSRSGERQRDLEARLGVAGERLSEAEVELQLLHLYRVSLELDTQRRAAAADALLQPAPGAGPSGAGGNASSAGNSTGNGTSGSGAFSSSSAGRNLLDGLMRRQGPSRDRAAAGPGRRRAGQLKEQQGRRREEGRQTRPNGVASGSAASGGGGQRSRKPQQPTSGGGSVGRGGRRRDGGGRSADREVDAAADGRSPPGRGAGDAAAPGRGSAADGAAAAGAAHLWGLPHAALRRAMARGRFGRPAAAVTSREDWASYTRTRPKAGQEAAEEQEVQPDAWAFIHYVSHVYAMHLQEWMKMQLQQTIRHEVNEMLVPTGDEEDGRGGDGGGGEGEEGEGQRVPAASASAAVPAAAGTVKKLMGQQGDGLWRCRDGGGGADHGQCSGHGDEALNQYGDGYDEYGEYGTWEHDDYYSA